MMITEYVEITQFPDGDSETGSRIEVRQKGDHEEYPPTDSATVAFKMTAAIVHLIKTGVVFSTMADLFKTEITGTFAIPEQD